MAGLVQIWAPLYQRSPFDEAFARDLRRAHRAWQGEDRLWLMPEAPAEGARWVPRSEGASRSECLVQAEAFNCIRVLNVDEGRRVFPPILPELWGTTLPKGLYQQWLNTEPYLTEGQPSIRMPIPRVMNGEVSYVEAEIGLNVGMLPVSGPMMPVREVHTGAPPTLRVAWPPSRIDGVLPVSPETESPRMERPVSHEQVFFNGSLIDVAVSSDAPAVRGLHVWLHWPEPFHDLFPLIGCNLELLHHHQVVMRACIKQWQDGDKDGALREAGFWVSRLTCEAQTTVEKGWFLPKAMTNSEEALYALQGDYQVEVNKLDDVPNSSGFRAIRHTVRPVQRVQDWLGYFWFELYHELKAYEIVGTCVDCGRVFRGGHRDRTKCSRTDNPECYRTRNAASKRKSRQKPKESS